MRIFSWFLEACGISMLAWWAYLVATRFWGWKVDNAEGICATLVMVLLSGAIADELIH
jgi:hypothetical protein